MRINTLLLLIGFLAGSLSPVHASDLIFPTTEREIVEILSSDGNRGQINGSLYEYDGHKLYKVINGKRYRMRGIRVMEAYPVLPKAGALVHFDLDSARINPNAYALLDEFGKALQGQLVDAVVLVAGHTDDIGTNTYNQKLSEQRAQAVIDYLVEHRGIATHRLISHGYGESRPIRPNDTEAGRARNRRVEFVRIE